MEAVGWTYAALAWRLWLRLLLLWLRLWLLLLRLRRLRRLWLRWLWRRRLLLLLRWWQSCRQVLRWRLASHHHNRGDSKRRELRGCAKATRVSSGAHICS